MIYQGYDLCDFREKFKKRKNSGRVIPGTIGALLLAKIEDKLRPLERVVAKPGDQKIMPNKHQRAMAELHLAIEVFELAWQVGIFLDLIISKPEDQPKTSG